MSNTRYPHLRKLIGRSPSKEWPEVSGPDLDLAEEKLADGFSGVAITTFLDAINSDHARFPFPLRGTRSGARGI